MIQFEIRANPGKWYFVLRVPGECVFVGDTLHASRAEAEREIEAVRTLALNDACYERRTLRHDQHYFVLKEATGKVIGSCDMCENASKCERAILNVKTYASRAPVQPK